jgi:hypothetical protein
MNNLLGMAGFRLPVSGVVRHGMEGQGKASTWAGRGPVWQAVVRFGKARSGSARHGAK